MDKSDKIYIAGHHSRTGSAGTNDLIREILVSRFDLRVAILFGSLAQGCAHSESDIDLAVLADYRLSAENKMALISELAQATGRPVDLIDLRAAGEPLLGQILRHGVRLLGSNADYAELLKRHLFDTADFVPYQARILAERRHAWTGK